MLAFISRWAFAALLVVSVSSGLVRADTDRGADDTVVPVFQHPEYEKLDLGVVTRILDENTVLVRVNRRYERYDLLGIADFKDPKSDEARAAAAYLKRSLLHEQVRIQFDTNPKRNTEGRFKVFLFRSPDHLFVNLELVRQGLVHADAAQLDLHRKDLSYHARRAQERQVGLWDQSPHSNPTPRATPSNVPDTSPKREAIRPETVYITQHGKKYHRERCAHLTDSSRPTSRDQVHGTHEPCKTCRPDEDR